ncbi:hypothetical protein HF325_005653 [Metschnikowia pulcherrima]|uniref:Uncharacterized protein n=1 Tax=Metschnikowia pulcherrima TaxID=27326 RepID=A0A8H7L982_9ASCO|nr:hypothetical protein HF325_005653 [Metschnikowia pulcherrima]
MDLIKELTKNVNLYEVKAHIRKAQNEQTEADLENDLMISYKYTISCVRCIDKISQLHSLSAEEEAVYHPPSNQISIDPKI